MDRIEKAFPGLNSGNYRLTSPHTVTYNCIAWAAGDTRRKWWPALFCYWPRVKRETSISAFVEAYGTLGYKPVVDGRLEIGIEKIAIYVGPDGSPLHAARQLASGKWTSKLGDWEDIEHTLEGLEGDAYGKINCFLGRPRVDI
jgi:hypothetical protein